MKRLTILLIIILAVVILAGAGWYLFLRNPEIPLGDAIRDALPFGSGENLDIPGLVRDNTSDEPLDQFSPDQFGSPTAKIFRISEAPIAGAVVFMSGAKITVRYADRATGNIYDAILPSNASSTKLDKVRITNNTLPKVYEAHFKSDGTAALFRSLREDSDMVENLSLELTPPKTGPQSTSTEFYTLSSTALRGDIGSVAVGAGNNLIYSLKDAKSITTSLFNGASPKTLLTSAFTDWKLVSAGNSVVVYTKASTNASGYAYTLNTSSGGLNKILGPLNALIATPNRAGNRVVYSYTNGGITKLATKNLTNGDVTEISPYSLAEKCVWSAKSVDNLFCAVPINGIGGGEPDLWYRGATHYSDRIWLFQTDTYTAEIVAEPKSSMDLDIDAIDLKLSPDEDYMIFTNKTDLSLWALRLN